MRPEAMAAIGGFRLASAAALAPLPAPGGTLDPVAHPLMHDLTASRTDAGGMGQRLYGQVCQSCHGPDGTMIADRRLGGIAGRQDQDATIAYTKDPRAPMPKLYPELLDEADVRAVAAWIHEELR